MPLVKLDKNYPHEKLDRVIRRKKSDHKIINKQIAKHLSVSEKGNHIQAEERILYL